MYSSESRVLSVHVSVCCTHPAVEYQKVCQAQGWGVCFVKACCIHSVHWDLVAGRSTGRGKERGRGKCRLRENDNMW